MAADNIVSINRNGSGPDSELAQSSATGEARLRELERLIQTAAEVQAQAEAELNQTTASQSVAQQRKAAADSVRRKAEAEMAKLRSELARQAEQQKQVWSPGDPVQAKSDFEVTTLTGSVRRGRFSDSAFLDSDLALNDEDKQLNARINSSSGRTAKGQQRRAAPAGYKQPRRSKRGWVMALLLIVGISAGGAATWIGVQNPDGIKQQINSLSERVTQLMPVSGAADAQQDEKAASALPPAATAQPTAAAPAKPAKTAEQRARERAAWQQAIVLQELRVRDAAENRFKQRLAD